MDKLTITLNVEAKNLYELSNPSQDDVEQKCSFYDSDGATSIPGRIKEFESKVNIDQDVWWEGKTNDKVYVDKDYTVAILSIVYKLVVNSENFFNTTAVCGNGGPKGKVKAKVKNKEDLRAKTNIYSINFNIHPPGGAPTKSFFIDPKLRANI